MLEVGGYAKGEDFCWQQLRVRGTHQDAARSPSSLRGHIDLMLRQLRGSCVEGEQPDMVGAVSKR
jgi:hypothetical protein